LARSDSAEQALIRCAIEQGNTDNLSEITAIIHKTNALNDTKQAAEDAVDRAIAALAVLPDSDYKTALIDLAKLSVNRNH
jgi:octaprenyl-diphosphate synthase